MVYNNNILVFRFFVTFRTKVDLNICQSFVEMAALVANDFIKVIYMYEMSNVSLDFSEFRGFLIIYITFPYKRESCFMWH